MAAVKIPANNVDGLQSRFDDYLKGAKEANDKRNSINSSLKDTKSYQSSGSNGSGSFFGDAVAAAAGGTALGGLVNAVVDRIKKAYEDKAESLGIGDFSGSGSESGSLPEPKPLPENSTLLTVLNQNSGGMSGIIEAINKLTEVIVLNGEVQQAYNDLNLEIQMSNSEINASYLDQFLQNLQTISKNIEDGTMNKEERDLIYDTNVAYFELFYEKLDDIGIKIRSSIPKDSRDTLLRDTLLDEALAKNNPRDFYDYDGNLMFEAKIPRDLAYERDAMTAVRSHQQNSFELDIEDYDDMFNPLADIDFDELFTYVKKSERLADEIS